MSEETTYEYDNSGRLWKVTDAKSQTTEYGYDSQWRIETISYADGNTVTLTYDADGNLAGYSDGETSASYTFDAMGRKLSETVNYGPFSKSFSYSYYGNGLKQTFTAPDSTVYTYTYGLNNELQTVQIPGVGNIAISEYTWNRPKTMTFPGGTQRNYTYDALMRLQSLSVIDPSNNPLFDSAYTYDEVGNILTKVTEHGNYTYGYDDSSRLLTADNPVLADETYTYDDVGNRLTSADVSGSWSYNTNNELLGYADVEYTYDENGNMTQKKIGTAAVNYIYDAANRLVKVEDDATQTVIAEYYYDPFGRRLWKDVGGTKTYFFYSEEGLIAEYDSSGNEIRSYGYQPDSTWTTDPLWLKEGGSYYWYQNDHLGTPQKLVDSTGTVVWSAQYTAFGEADVQVETVTNNLRFPGQYEDAETGLHYNFHRYYDPKIGRYLRVDPLGLDGGINLFVYSDNNPLAFRDVYGLYPTFDVVGCCGPDVTDLLKQTLQKIRQTYATWETRDQWRSCTYIIDLPLALALAPINLLLSSGKSVAGLGPSMAWDIWPFWGMGMGRLTAEKAFRSSPSDIKNGTGGKGPFECGYTVAYQGTCFKANYLNYIQWGLMFRLCSESYEQGDFEQFMSHPFNHDSYIPTYNFWTLDAAKWWAEWWKTRKYDNKVAVPTVLSVVTAGYTGGGTTFPVPLESSCKGLCEVDEKNKVIAGPLDSMHWVWEPARPRWPILGFNTNKP